MTLDDVLDLRAYERVREEYRRRVIAHKQRRRVALGPIVTALFESFDTVRFQVQEMARAERMISDEAIQEELDIYNRILPAPGELSATVFIELTSEEELRHWLPALRGIERAVRFELGEGAARSVVESLPEESHARALSREEVTPAVHYVRFPFSAGDAERFKRGPVVLAVRHRAYEAATFLSDETRAELEHDLDGRVEPLPLA